MVDYIQYISVSLYTVISNRHAVLDGMARTLKHLKLQTESGKDHPLPQASSLSTQTAYFLNQRNIGLGCYIENQFLGAFGYADDIVLLSPSLEALHKMVNICKLFCDNHGLKISVDRDPKKSKQNVYNLIVQILRLLTLFSITFQCHGRTHINIWVTLFQQTRICFMTRKLNVASLIPKSIPYVRKQVNNTHQFL